MKNPPPHQPQEHTQQRRILAIASSGGHWVQLLRLRPAFEGHKVIYATNRRAYQSEIGGEEFYTVPDATRWNKIGLIKCALVVLWIIIKTRPHAIITTGAAPGHFALRIGKLFGKKTVWLDSIANAEVMSMSGAISEKFATLWLTQWKHIAERGGPEFFGSVLGDELSAPIHTPATHENKSSNTEKSIFVTVGNDVPLDRLIKAVDEWKATLPNSVKVFAQVGNSEYKAKHIETCKFLSPEEFNEKLENCCLVIAHAGMGTILSALKAQKPILTLPRLGSLKETRNDHQVATAQHLLKIGVIQVAFSTEELQQMLQKVSFENPAGRISPWADRKLTEKLKSFIESN